MSLWKIAWRSIQQRALASTLTAISMALGVALVITVLVIHGVVQESFTRGAQGYHLVVGKKGSQLQLVLNTVYHLQESMEPMPYSFYKEFLKTSSHKGKYSGYVDVVIPYCLGDNYEGYRVVGTVPELFEKLSYSSGKQYAFQDGGRNFDPEHFFEAVIGAEVARKTGLEVGSEFQPTHGLGNEGDGHKHDAFKVVGILEPTGTANDRALFVNIEGFYLLDNHAKPVEKPAPKKPAAETAAAHDHADEKHDHDHAAETATKSEGGATKEPAHDAKGEHDHAHDDHDHAHEGHDHAHHDHAHHDHDHGHAHHHEPLPEEQREVTALLVRAKDDQLAALLHQKINEGLEAQAASPIRVIQEFFTKMVNNVSVVLLALTILIMIEAGVGILVSIYNSMNDRRRDIAVMRALGARRGTVMAVVLLESILLSVGGGLMGFVLGHGLIAAISPWVESQTGVSVGFLQFAWFRLDSVNANWPALAVPYELVLIPCLVVLASLVGYLPAVSAYRTDVAKALTANP